MRNFHLTIDPTRLQALEHKPGQELVGREMYCWLATHPVTKATGILSIVNRGVPMPLVDFEAANIRDYEQDVQSIANESGVIVTLVRMSVQEIIVELLPK